MVYAKSNESLLIVFNFQDNEAELQLPLKFYFLYSDKNKKLSGTFVLCSLLVLVHSIPGGVYRNTMAGFNGYIFF